MSARQGVEDVVQEAAKRQAMRRWEAQYDAGLQGDVSPPDCEAACRGGADAGAGEAGAGPGTTSGGR